jgi:hypothetical protein
MPPGVPVATVGVDAAKNAAYLAVSILALKRPELGERLRAFRLKVAEEVAAASVVTWKELGVEGEGELRRDTELRNRSQSLSVERSLS